MKKIFNGLLVVMLAGIIAGETPIVIKSMQKEDAIELLNKVYEYENYEVTKNYASDGVAYAEKEMNKKDYAKVIERYHDRDCVSLHWYSNQYNNLAYYFDVGKKECYPEYTTEIEFENILPNENILSMIKDHAVKDLEFRNIEYDGVESLEIKFQKTNDVVVIDKATGFVFTEYNEKGGVTTTYTYKIGKLINNHLKPDFNGYTICVEIDPVEWQKSIVLNVIGDENLPEDFRTSFKDANNNLVDELNIKSTDEN